MAKRDSNANLLESRDEAVPVKGRVIRPDFIKPLTYALAGLFIVGVGLFFMLLGFRTGIVLMAARAAAFGIQGALILAGGVLVCVGMLMRNRRLIVGHDRL